MTRRLIILSASLLLLIVGSAFYLYNNNDEDRIKIILLGDSITQGKNPGAPTDQTFDSLISTYFFNHHLSTEIINAGITGETADDGLRRLQYDVIDKRPDIVVILFGTNDAFVDYGSTTERLPVDDYKKRISSILKKLVKANIRPVLMTPVPMCSVPDMYFEPYISKGINFFIKPYIAACREIADQMQIPLIDNYRHWEEKQNMGVNICEWFVDGIHPNAEGHRQIARTMFPVLITEAFKVHSQEIVIRVSEPLNFISNETSDFLDQDNYIAKGITGDIYSKYIPTAGDFEISSDFRVKFVNRSTPIFQIGESEIIFNQEDNAVYLKGILAGNKILHIGRNLLKPQYNSLIAKRKQNVCEIILNDQTIHRCFYKDPLSGFIGFVPGNAAFEISNFKVYGDLVEVPGKSKISYIPLLDLAYDSARQIIVDREKGQYLGHPTTVLFDDNSTMLTVYPKGHGKGEIVMKKSLDAGLTWSDRLPVPETWITSQEVPTLYRIKGIANDQRMVLFSGLFPIRMAHSEDNGASWSELEPVFNFGGVVVVSDLIRLKDGTYMAFFHDDGSFYKQYAKKTNDFIVYKITSPDGLSWSDPEVVVHHKTAYLCEGGAVRSPDGNTIALLMRENLRVYNSMVIFSSDEGKTWSEPVELPASLTGDRHTLRYAPDGRIVATFRDMGKMSLTQGDFVAWVGTWEDLADGREGSYRIRLLDNKHSMDCGYPGLEVLPNGTFIATTYGHWEEDEEPYIMNVRFTLSETDALLNK